MFSKFFIDRPIFATVLAVLMVLAGILTVKTLPIAQYPDITPPTVMVSASYPGANAATVARTVGVPIEQTLVGVADHIFPIGLRLGRDFPFEAGGEARAATATQARTLDQVDDLGRLHGREALAQGRITVAGDVFLYPLGV